jgi:hypothetical protein
MVRAQRGPIMFQLTRGQTPNSNLRPCELLNPSLCVVLSHADVEDDHSTEQPNDHCRHERKAQPTERRALDATVSELDDAALSDCHQCRPADHACTHDGATRSSTSRLRKDCLPPQAGLRRTAQSALPFAYGTSPSYAVLREFCQSALPSAKETTHERVRKD